MYFNYHAKAKNLIKNRKLIAFKITSNHNGISPALMLYFSCNQPMPIREDRWQEYFSLIAEIYQPNQ